MAIARVCITCGLDIGHAAPWKEPHYGLLVCRCRRCGSFAPAISRRRPRPWTRIWTWLRFALTGAATFVVCVLALALTALHERDLDAASLGIKSLIFHGHTHDFFSRFMSYITEDGVDIPTRWPIAALLMRVGVGILAGLWCLVLPSRHRFWSSLALLFLCTCTMGAAVLLIDAVDTMSYADPGANSILVTTLLDALPRALALVLTFLIAAPLALARRRSLALHAASRSIRFRRLLHKRRRRRRS